MSPNDLLKKHHVSFNQIEGFCQKWEIVEFSLFGSILRSDFGPGSDIDVLVAFS